LGTDYVKVVEDTPKLSQRKCRPKNVVFSNILFIAIFMEVTKNECFTENRGQIT